MVRLHTESPLHVSNSICFRCVHEIDLSLPVKWISVTVKATIKEQEGEIREHRP